MYDDICMMAARVRGYRCCCFAWIGLVGAAFTVPDQCRAQQPPSAGRDILTVPIVEGRDIRFRRLSNPQNLSHVRVESIVQDTQGFMWFGTWNGLNRYDGYKFKVFVHDPRKPTIIWCPVYCRMAPTRCEYPRSPGSEDLISRQAPSPVTTNEMAFPAMQSPVC